MMHAGEKDVMVISVRKPSAIIHVKASNRALYIQGQAMLKSKTPICIVIAFLILASLNVSAQTQQTGAAEGIENTIAVEKQSDSYHDPNPGATWTEPVTGMPFIYIPKGCFQMGSNSGDDDEKPLHEVCLDSFWIGKYEVTQGQWKKIMGQNPARFDLGDNYPVEQISWHAAKTFIAKLNQQSGKLFSLPTEAQWEFAARSGGKDQRYAGGDNLDDLAWYRSNSEYKTHRVGTKKPNDFGLYDMSGNVAEWCEDVYLSQGYSKHARHNPLVTSGGSLVVLRGGSWVNTPEYMRATFRLRFSADYLYSDLGFRLCLRGIQP